MLCESSSAVVAGNMAKTVLVYSDKGAGTRSVVTTIQALQRNLHSVNVSSHKDCIACSVPSLHIEFGMNYCPCVNVHQAGAGEANNGTGSL